jgi:hypothetical protein
MSYAENYKLIQWTKRPEPEVIRSARSREANAPYYMPDIKPFVSPMSGKELSSRRQVQHEERGYGVRQCGELKNVSDFDNTKTARSRNDDPRHGAGLQAGPGAPSQHQVERLTTEPLAYATTTHTSFGGDCGLGSNPRGPAVFNT